MNYVASPHFKPHSRRVCFLSFLPWSTNGEGCNFLLKPARWPNCSSLHTPEGKCMLVFGFQRGEGNSRVLTGVFGVRGLLCIPLFVWACQSVCRELRSGVYLVTHPLPAPPMWTWFKCLDPIWSFWISLLFPWWSKGAGRWWLRPSRLVYLVPKWTTSRLLIGKDRVGTLFFFARASYCGAVLGCSVTLNTNAASINRVWLFFWGPIF